MSSGISQYFGPTRPASSKPRPPPLDLTNAREIYPRMFEQNAPSTEQVPYSVQADERDSKRTSLPAYLVESYRRIALHNVDEVSEAPAPLPSRYVLSTHCFRTSCSCRTLSSSSISQEIMSSFLRDSPMEGASSAFPNVLANTASNSPDMSAPITPLSLAYEPVDGLTFPEDMVALDNFGVDAQDGGWDVAAAAIQHQLLHDETPRASKGALMVELGDPLDLAP